MSTSTARKLALASHLGIDADDIENEISEDRYTENAFDAEGKTFLVLTDEEADEAARDAVRDSLWACNASFLTSYIPTLRNERASRAWQKMVSELCEDAGPLVEAMLGNRLEECLGDAVSLDGRGHFLAGYDSEESEVVIDNVSTFYIYRTN